MKKMAKKMLYAMHTMHGIIIEAVSSNEKDLIWAIRNFSSQYLMVRRVQSTKSEYFQNFKIKEST